MQLSVKGDAGERLIEPPAKVEAGEEILFGYQDEEKEFELGQRIEFTPQEFVQLATTFLLFGLQIQQSIHALQEARRPD